jgi:V8-like Glu-specific endopeptidase
MSRFLILAVGTMWMIFITPAGIAGRVAYTAHAPDWLLAVGRLTVPGRDTVDGEARYREENCSASLIGPQTIVTAWHCFEFYTDLSRDPVFTLPNAPRPDPVVARRVADGGGMAADWALLRLETPILNVTPIPVARYDAVLRDSRFALAGYARDEELGQRGRILTWESQCLQTTQERTRVGIDCITYKGASGGPVVAQGRLIGVISAGDGAAVTYFVPSHLFMLNLRLHRR